MLGGRCLASVTGSDPSTAPGCGIRPTLYYFFSSYCNKVFVELYSITNCKKTQTKLGLCCDALFLKNPHRHSHFLGCYAIIWLILNRCNLLSVSVMVQEFRFVYNELFVISNNSVVQKLQITYDYTIIFLLVHPFI